MENLINLPKFYLQTTTYTVVPLMTVLLKLYGTRKLQCNEANTYDIGDLTYYFFKILHQYITLPYSGKFSNITEI